MNHPQPTPHPIADPATLDARIAAAWIRFQAPERSKAAKARPVIQ